MADLKSKDTAASSELTAAEKVLKKYKQELRAAEKDPVGNRDISVIRRDLKFDLEEALGPLAPVPELPRMLNDAVGRTGGSIPVLDYSGTFPAPGIMRNELDQF